MTTAQIVALNEKDAEFTGLFAASLIQVFQTDDRVKLMAEIERMNPDAELRAKLPGFDVGQLQRTLLDLRFAHYIERLSQDGLPKMVRANWLDFTTTVIECLPAEARGKVWDYLDEHDDQIVRLRDWLQPLLQKLQWYFDKHENGGLPPLQSVPE